jgi:hypothetical protein
VDKLCALREARTRRVSTDLKNQKEGKSMIPTSSIPLSLSSPVRSPTLSPVRSKVHTKHVRDEDEGVGGFPLQGLDRGTRGERGERGEIGEREEKVDDDERIEGRVGGLRTRSRRKSSLDEANPIPGFGVQG